MTVIVALKTGDYLQPRGQHFTVEPGIVMAGDTRVSFINGSQPHEDDHIKVDTVGNFAIVGYAGNCKIATSVLTKLEEAIEAAGDYTPESVASILQGMLVQEDSSNIHLSLRLRKVQVLLGVRDPKVENYILYEMDTEKKFEPELRDMLATIGSHGKFIRKVFRDIRRGAAYPFNGPVVTLKDDSAMFVKFLLDKALETANEVEGKGSFIGGVTHLAVLHSKGVVAMEPDINAKLIL